jgi:hypothetical protein
MIFRRALLALLAWVAFEPPMPCRAAVLHVPDNYSQIQAALDASQAGDTVLVAPGHYHERLVFPNRDLTLASHILLTGDTLLMDQTILDGDNLGTTVTILPTEPHHYVLDGFTIRRGQGAFRVGGGLHTSGPSHLVVRHVLFAENTNIYSGSGFLAFSNQAVHMEHIRISDNSAAAVGEVVAVSTLSIATLRNFHVREPQLSRIFDISARDTVFVSDVIVENQDVVTSVGIGTNNPWDFGYVEVRDIFFRNNSWNVDPMLTISSSWYLHVRNIWCTDNRQWGNVSDGGYYMGVVIRGHEANVDSLFFFRNRATALKCAGGSAGGVIGIVRNVFVEDCVVGDSSYVGEQSFSTSNSLFITGSNEVQNLVMRRNRFIYAPPPNDPDPTSEFKAVLFKQTMYSVPPSNIIEDCVFEDNEVIDLRDFSTITRPIEGIHGWGIHVESPNHPSYQMRNCIFRNNRYRNLNPEYPWRELSTDDYWVDTNIGSFMYFDMDPADNSSFSIQNCLFDGNDDGLSIGHHPADGGGDEFIIENTVFRNLSRRALYFRGIRGQISNCLFDGIHSYLPTSSESEQVALAAISGDTTYVCNSAFINCSLPGLLLPGGSSFDWGEYNETGRIVFDGCVFWNNTVDQFEAEPSGWYLMPDAPIDLLPLPGVYRHCLLPEPMALQSNCLVGVDPQFDPLLGAPFLSATSPCVDAGNPDPAFDDPEDPAAPGMALFPSLGTRRNDIGLFGGPLAAQLDTAWLALPAWNALARPKGFHLGSPWPNPFNPVMRIPLTLERPLPVRLTVHNLLGQEVAVLVNGILPAGTHILPFQAGKLASGVYVVQLEAGGKTESRAVTLLR